MADSYDYQMFLKQLMGQNRGTGLKAKATMRAQSRRQTRTKSIGQPFLLSNKQQAQNGGPFLDGHQRQEAFVKDPMRQSFGTGFMSIPNSNTAQ
mmetsp:Transcript_26963/g.41088  ORF Transcript_26963/g.41088 Transcript_26963/m.41088 type:complete len:94 (+) Transcript_26963:25-306(+)